MPLPAIFSCPSFILKCAFSISSSPDILDLNLSFLPNCPIKKTGIFFSLGFEKPVSFLILV
jgi:hypothetical protein